MGVGSAIKYMVGADDLHRTFELRLAPLRGAREIEEDVVLEVAAKFVGLILEAINRVLAGAGRREHVDLAERLSWHRRDSCANSIFARDRFDECRQQLLIGEQILGEPM